MSIVRASSVPAVSLLIVDYFLDAPAVCGQYFFGKITIALYWLPQIVLLSGSRVRIAISAIPARGSVRARRSPIRR
jgi:hypothetical protein